MRFFYYLLLIITSSVFAQESFLEHKTQKGETAYSVLQKYDISLHELYLYNPVVKEKDGNINQGQVLQIPIYSKLVDIPKKTTESSKTTTNKAETKLNPSTVVNTSGNIADVPKKTTESITTNKAETKLDDNTVLKTYSHVVAEHETLYSLSRMYNVSLETIRAENKDILTDEIKIGQILFFPNAPVIKSNENNSQNYDYDDKDAVIHTVKPKETFFSLARDYNVSVEDIAAKNKLKLEDGLEINQQIKIPNKKKTVDGRVRVINESTIFHTVLPFETKYSISRLYGITIEQLEIQNPEIITVLKEGNKLAINKDLIKPKNANEELMLVLAEKQVAVEKSKVKNTEIQYLRDRLKNQEIMNQKVGTINKLNFDLNLVDLKSTDIKTVENLKLVLEANRKVQMVLRNKLDSLIYFMNNDLENLKTMPISDLEEVKKLEKASLENVAKTNEMSRNLKKELAENRKSYSDLMNKIERLALTENQEYKRKLREGQSKKANVAAPAISIAEVKNYQNSHGENDIVNELLISRVDVLSEKKKEEVKKQISEASSNLKQTNLKQANREQINRELEDKLAMILLNNYKAEAIERRKKNKIKEDKIVPISLSKVIELLAKNPEFYKNEIASMKEIKNLKNVDDGFYIVANDIVEPEQRDLFIKKLYDDGEFESGFFYNTNTSSYVVYLGQFTTSDGFIGFLKQKEKNPYYKKIKIFRLQSH